MGNCHLLLLQTMLLGRAHRVASKWRSALQCYSYATSAPEKAMSLELQVGDGLNSSSAVITPEQHKAKSHTLEATHTRVPPQSTS